MTQYTAADNLSGKWDGIFNYPRGQRSNKFVATLRDSSGFLVGESSEPSDGRDDCHATLIALIEGRHDGAAVRFLKSYDDPARAHYAVEYNGSVSSDGLEIHGIWTIPGVWSGTFIMVRPSRRAKAIEQKVTETVR